MNEMRKRCKKQEKRFNHKATYLIRCIEYDLSYNVEEESILFQNEQTNMLDYLISKDLYGKHKNKVEDEEVVLPLRVTIGVTMSLVGLFLYFVPFPICQAAAPWVMETGIAFLIDQGITEWEEKQKEGEK